MNQQQVALVGVASEQLPLLSGQSISERHAMSPGRVEAEGVWFGPVITEASSTVSKVLDLVGPEAEQPRSLSDLEHPVTAYLNGLAPSSRRPQLAAPEAIARRSTQVFDAGTMPWQRLRPHHVLKIRSLLEENYLPATANRMLSGLRGVLRECWHSGLLSTEEYRMAVDVEPVRGESEPRGRDLSATELRGLLEACARAPEEVKHRQDSAARRRRDAAFLSLLYASGLRRAEAVALELPDLDMVSGQLRVRRGKGANHAQSRCRPRLSRPSRTGWWCGAQGRDLSSVPCSRTVALSATRKGSCKA